MVMVEVEIEGKNLRRIRDFGEDELHLVVVVEKIGSVIAASSAATEM